MREDLCIIVLLTVAVRLASIVCYELIVTRTRLALNIATRTWGTDVFNLYRLSEPGGTDVFI